MTERVVFRVCSGVSFGLGFLVAIVARLPILEAIGVASGLLVLYAAVALFFHEDEGEAT